MLKKAMILAAGFGTRLMPLTEKIPKALIKHKGKPMMENVILKLINSGISEIIINTHYLSQQVENYFNENKFGVTVKLIHEDKILGTGGAIKNARIYLEDEEDFLVYNVDVDCQIDLNNFYAFHKSADSLASLAVKKRNTARPLIIDDNNNLAGRTVDGRDTIFTDKTLQLSKTAFCGIHIISSEIFNFFPSENNFDIMPVYVSALKNGKIIKCFDIGDIFWQDLGKPENLI